VFIENDVVLGDRVTVKCGVQLWDGTRVGDDVFIGPNATFINDRFPRSRNWQESVLQTVIENGAAVGANATVLPGIRIGKKAMVGAGAVVTHNVPPGAIVIGNPARITGYVDSSNFALATEGQVTWNNLEPGAKVPLLGGAYLTVLPSYRDARGTLSVAERAQVFPFPPERTFFVYDVPSQYVRGEHAHRVCQQFLICVNGSVSVVVDDGANRKEVVLDSPQAGLFIPPLVWATQYRYQSQTVLAVFASHSYDPADYIRDYDEFLALVDRNLNEPRTK
jgi:dTDP-4-dehydrorhamnose 3,5-epimerase-like enzyme